jgi:hypothetical protein
METVRADIGVWPGVMYVIGLVVAVLAMWRWDMRQMRKARREQMRQAELMRQHLTFLHSDGQGSK